MEALGILTSESFELAIVDVLMPQMNGLDLLHQIRERFPDLSVVMATAVDSAEVAAKALRAGADDYLTKPLRMDMVSSCASRVLEARERRCQKLADWQKLRKTVSEQSEDILRKDEQIRRIFLNTIQSLVFTLEAKDPYTEGHPRRVGAAAGALAEFLPDVHPSPQELRIAGLLHDIGKIAVRESVLGKPSRLTDDEYEHIKTHPQVSARILGPVIEVDSVLDAVKHHHERYDGRGYPDGLRAEDIPYGARVLGVIDAYDAMVSGRVYRKGRSHEEAVEEITENLGTQFDPKIGMEFCDGSKDIWLTACEAKSLC